jgi:hypothetical protein
VSQWQDLGIIIKRSFLTFLFASLYGAWCKEARVQPYWGPESVPHDWLSGADLWRVLETCGLDRAALKVGCSAWGAMAMKSMEVMEDRGYHGNGEQYLHDHLTFVVVV